jgi:ComF family protein
MDAERQVYKWLRFVRNALYPSHCVLCGGKGESGLDLCRGCLAELPRLTQACRRCGAPLGIAAALCGPCSRRPPSFARSHIPFRYEAPLDHLLQQLKFHQNLHLAPLLATLMAEAIGKREAPLPQYLLPVPLHPQRLRERGYNQALELARPLSRLLGIPLAPRLCRRRHPTLPQTSLKGKERRRNLRGAFVAFGRGMPRHLAIVDDVVTTGATVEELARTLRRAGVEEVEVWACARAGR